MKISEYKGEIAAFIAVGVTLSAIGYYDSV